MVDRVTQRVAVDVVATTAVAEAARLPKAVVITAITAVKAAAISAVAHVPPTPASHGKTQVTAAEMAKAMVPRHAVSAAHKPHGLCVTTSRAFRATKSSVKTHVARALTWVTSPTILTNVSPPVMCRPAFHHQACPHGAVVVEAEAATVEAVVVEVQVEAEAATVVAVVALAETGAAVAHVQAAAEAAQAADFSAD